MFINHSIVVGAHDTAYINISHVNVLFKQIQVQNTTVQDDLNQKVPYYTKVGIAIYKYKITNANVKGWIASMETTYVSTGSNWSKLTTSTNDAITLMEKPNPTTADITKAQSLIADARTAAAKNVTASNTIHKLYEDVEAAAKKENPNFSV